MKIIVIGLGNFGMSLAINLSNTGNEVIVVDENIEKINQIKDKVAHAVAMDATNENAYAGLPMKNTDLAVIAIGGYSGAGILSTAIVKKLTSGKIISRSSSGTEDTILEAMGVDHIVHPEREFADKLTKGINLKGSIDNFEIDENYLVSEVPVHNWMIGKSILDLDFRNKVKLNIITIIRSEAHNSLLGRSVTKKEVIGMAKPGSVFIKDDILVVFGKDSHIKKYLNSNDKYSID